MANDIRAVINSCTTNPLSKEEFQKILEKKDQADFAWLDSKKACRYSAKKHKIPRTILITAEKGHEIFLMTKIQTKGDIALAPGGSDCKIVKKVCYGVHLTLGIRLVVAVIRKEARKHFPQERVCKEEEWKRAIYELELMKKFRGTPEIVWLLAGLTFRNKIYLIMKDYTEGNLHEKIVRGISSDDTKLRLICECWRGLSKMHAQQIIHRDLKPLNIFLYSENSKLHAVIGDLGFACEVGSEEAKKVDGKTLPWTSPEHAKALLAGSLSAAQIGEISTMARDVFVMGCITYVLLSGRLFWFQWDENQGEEKGKQKLAAMEDSHVATDLKARLPDLSSPLKRVIESTVCRDPAKRASAADIVKLLDN